MHESTKFPAIYEEYPYSSQDFIKNSEVSISKRTIYWIKTSKPAKLIIEAIQLIKKPDWKLLLKKAIKRNNNEVIKFILQSFASLIFEEPEMKQKIMEIAEFYQDKNDESIIEMLKKYNICKIDDFISEALATLDQNTPAFLNKQKNNGELFKFDNIGQTIAHYAAKRGNLYFFEWIAQNENFQKIFTTKSKCSGNTPLHIAVQHSQESIVSWALLQIGKHNWLKEFITNETNYKGETLLFLSAKKGNSAIFTKISGLFQTLSNAKNIKGFSISNIVCYKNNNAVLNSLKNLSNSSVLSKDDFVLSSKHGNTTLMTNIKNQLQNKKIHVDERSKILSKQGNFWNFETDGDCNIITAATKQGNLEILSNFVDANPNILAYNSFLLHLASGEGHQHIVEQLLTKSINIFEQSTGNVKKTAQGFAKGNKDIKKLLLHSMITTIISNKSFELFRTFWKKLKQSGESIINRKSKNSGQTILQYAVKAGDIQIIEKIMKLKPDCNIQDNEGKTAIFYCIDPENINIFSILLSNGASIFVPDKKFITPLHLIAELGKIHFLELIIAKYSEQKGLIPGINPVIHALTMHKEEMAIALLDFLTNQSSQSKELLFIAAANNYPSAIKALLQRGIKNLDPINNLLQTPLIVAISNKNTKIAILLLENCANVNHQTELNNTALIMALQRDCSTFFIEKLLIMGANPNLCSKSGFSPLSLSIEKENKAVFDLLLKYNAEINISEANTRYLFDLSFKAKSSHFAIGLAKKGANNIQQIVDNLHRNLLIRSITLKRKKIFECIVVNELINQIDYDGKTALFHAVETNQEEFVKILLEKGANFSFTYSNKENLLTLAVSQKNIEIIQLLLKFGIDINMQNWEGETGLSKAVELNDESFLITLLERQDIDINRPNKNGETPLLKTVIRKNAKILEILIKLKKLNMNFPDKNQNQPLLALPFHEPEVALNLLAVLLRYKERIDLFVRNASGENILIKALKNNNNEQIIAQKKGFFKKLINLILKSGQAKNQAQLNSKDSQKLSAFDIAISNKHFRVAKKLLFSGCEGAKNQNPRRKRLTLIIQQMSKNLMNMPKIRRIEKRFEVLDQFNI